MFSESSYGFPGGGEEMAGRDRGLAPAAASVLPADAVQAENRRGTLPDGMRMPRGPRLDAGDEPQGQAPESRYPAGPLRHGQRMVPPTGPQAPRIADRLKPRGPQKARPVV